jgi:hypothetical protein
MKESVKTNKTEITVFLFAKQLESFIKIKFVSQKFIQTRLRRKILFESVI